MAAGKFIQKAKEIHGEKYDYSLVTYINCDTKVKIKCLVCDIIFEQIPYNHVNKKAGCIKCKNTNKAKETLTMRLNEFITKAKEIHGEKYDYSKVIYTNSKTLVIILCNTCHTEFKQIRNTHLTGDGGCKECCKTKLKDKRTFTPDQFIERAKVIHGEKYDYSGIVYVNSQTHVTIRCISCNHHFPTLPNNHLRGKGCKKCATKLNTELRRKPQEQFIIEAIEKHKDDEGIPLYDYSLVHYKSSHDEIDIICKIHGQFSQSAGQHLTGRGCNECGILKRSLSQRFTQDQFIERAQQLHGGKYDYSKVEYINSQTAILIKCNTCEYTFPQSPNSHLQGAGCDNCAHIINHENQKLTISDIIKRCEAKHGDKFDYSDINYVNSNTPINIKCNKCNRILRQSFNNHIKQTTGCSFCGARKNYSMKAVKYLEFIASYNSINIRHKLNGGEFPIPNSRCKADGYCEETNTIYEFHGTVFHGDPRLCNPSDSNFHGKNYGELYDKTKQREKFITDSGYNLKVMWEYDWNNAIKCVKLLQKMFRKKYYAYKEYVNITPV